MKEFTAFLQNLLLKGGAKMTDRISLLGVGLALAGLLFSLVPGIGWLLYAGGLFFSVWGLFTPQRQLAWWGVGVSALSAAVRVLLATFVIG